MTEQPRFCQAPGCGVQLRAELGDEGSDMLPGLPKEHVADARLGNAQLFGQLGLVLFATFVFAASFDNLFGSQFSLGSQLAFYLAAFGGFVVRVVNMSSEEKMKGVDTQWVVAAVTDAQVAVDWPNAQFVGETMSFSSPPIALNPPVASGVRFSQPRYAAANGLATDATEEQIFNGDNRCSTLAHACPFIHVDLVR